MPVIPQAAPVKLPSNIVSIKKAPKIQYYPKRSELDFIRNATSEDYDKKIAEITEKAKKLPKDTGKLSGVQQAHVEALGDVYDYRKSVLKALSDAITERTRILNQQKTKFAQDNAEVFLKKLVENATRAGAYEIEFERLQRIIEKGPSTKDYAPALAKIYKYRSETGLISNLRDIEAIKQRYEKTRPDIGQGAKEQLEEPETQLMKLLALQGGPKINKQGGIEKPSSAFSKIKHGAGVALTPIDKLFKIIQLPTSAMASTLKAGVNTVRFGQEALGPEETQKWALAEQKKQRMFMKQPGISPEKKSLHRQEVLKLRDIIQAKGDEINALYDKYYGRQDYATELKNILSLKKAVGFTEPLTAVEDLPGGAWLNKGWGPFKAKHLLGVGADIALNPLTYTMGALNPVSKLKGAGGRTFNQALSDLLLGAEHPELKNLSRIVEGLRVPGTAVAEGEETATGLLTKAGKAAKTTTPAQFFAKAIHAKPVMTDAEKMALWRYNTSKSLSQGIVGQTAKQGRKLARGVSKSEQRKVYGMMYDVANAPSEEAMGEAFRLAYAYANKTGQLALLKHNLQAMRDMSSAEIPAGFLQHIRPGYLPGIQQGKTNVFKRELENLKRGWRGESVMGEGDLATPIYQRAIPGRDVNLEMAMKRGGKGWEEISAEHPGFVKNPLEAISAREKTGLSRVLSNQSTKALVREGGLDQTAEVTARVMERASQYGEGVVNQLKFLSPEELKATDMFKSELRNFKQEMSKNGYRPMRYRTGNPKEGLGGGRVAEEPTREAVWVDQRLAEFIAGTPGKRGIGPYSLSSARYPTSTLGKAIRKPTDFWRKLATTWMGPKYFLTRGMGDPFRAYEGGLFPGGKDVLNSLRMMVGRTPGDIKLSTGKTLAGADAEALVRGLDVSAGGMLYGQGKNLYNPWTKFWNTVNTKQQEFYRQAEFLKGLRKTGEPGSALEALNRVGFNFQDLAAAEARYGKSIAPFYAWSRKNVPFQLGTALKNPGAFVPIAAGQTALENRAPGQEPNWLESMLTPDYIKNQGYLQNVLTTGGMPTSVMPKLPYQSLNFLPNLLDNPEEISFMGNPIVSMAAELALGKTRTGETLRGGLNPQTAPDLRPISDPFGELLSKVGLATQGVDERTGKPVWKIASKLDWLMKALPPLQAANQMMRTDVPSRAATVLSKLLPTDIRPVDYQRGYLGKLSDTKQRQQTFFENLQSRGGVSTKGPGRYDFTEMMLPPGPQFIYQLLKQQGLPKTDENIQRLYDAITKEGQEEKLISPMPWGTPEDVRQAYNRKRLYSYNQAAMTPEQIAAWQAHADTLSGGGGGYWGSGRRTTGRIKKVKTTKVKIPNSRGLPISGLGSLAGSTGSALGIPPLGLPAAPNLPNQPNSLQYMVNMLSGAQTAPTAPAGGLTHTTGSTDMGLPPDMAASLQQIMSAFFAQNGGATPANLAAFQAMMQQQGISSPQIMALIQQVYSSMQGGVPVG